MSEPRAKYGNKKTKIDGVTFDSRKEAAFYGMLKMMKLSGQITDYDLQPKFIYKVTYTRESYLLEFNLNRKYIADFAVHYPDGRTEYWDVKGVKTAIYKQKKKIIEKLYGITIIEK